MPGVGRFAGEDWIKGNIEQSFSLNQVRLVTDTLQLLRNDDTGDLYSFVGDANSPLTILCGYNDANVNYAYGVDVKEILNKKNEKYEFNVNARGRKVKYVNARYGNLYDIWNGLHPQLYFVPGNKRCVTSD